MHEAWFVIIGFLALVVWLCWMASPWALVFGLGPILLSLGAAAIVGWAQRTAE